MPESCFIPDCLDPADCSYVGLGSDGQPWVLKLCDSHFRLTVATQGMTDEEAVEWARKNRPGGEMSPQQLYVEALHVASRLVAVMSQPEYMAIIQANEPNSDAQALGRLVLSGRTR